MWLWCVTVVVSVVPVVVDCGDGCGSRLVINVLVLCLWKVTVVFPVLTVWLW